MSSPPSTPKRKASGSISFVKNTNPEILKVTPRPGGIIHIPTSTPKSVRLEDDIFGVQKEFEAHIAEKVSKEFRVQTALDDAFSINSEDITLPNEIKDAMYMLGVTISSIILMAANHSLSKEHIEWTKHCLESIRDDFGNHPPNVQGILNHMKTIQPAAEAEAEGEAGAEDEAGFETPEPPDTARGDEFATVQASMVPEDELEEQTIRSTTRVRMGSRDET